MKTSTSGSGNVAGVLPPPGRAACRRGLATNKGPLPRTQSPPSPCSSAAGPRLTRRGVKHGGRAGACPRQVQARQVAQRAGQVHVRALAAQQPPQRGRRLGGQALEEEQQAQGRSHRGLGSLVPSRRGGPQLRQDLALTQRLRGGRGRGGLDTTSTTTTTGDCRMLQAWAATRNTGIGMQAQAAGGHGAHAWGPVPGPGQRREHRGGGGRQPSNVRPQCGLLPRSWDPLGTPNHLVAAHSRGAGIAGQDGVPPRAPALGAGLRSLGTLGTGSGTYAKRLQPRTHSICGIAIHRGRHCQRCAVLTPGSRPGHAQACSLQGDARPLDQCQKARNSSAVFCVTRRHEVSGTLMRAQCRVIMPSGGFGCRV